MAFTKAFLSGMLLAAALSAQGLNDLRRVHKFTNAPIAVVFHDADSGTLISELNGERKNTAFRVVGENDRLRRGGLVEF
jgi:hypothetical protein